MLTRLRVKGFKNLVDVDVHFGPFTCIAGANGVGKSNLFDAIRFMSALADDTFLDAARSVRDEAGKTGDVRAIFNRVGGIQGRQLEFEAEMIVPETGADDLGQVAAAQTTFLQYKLVLRHRPSGPVQLGDGFELITEELTSFRSQELAGLIQFPHSAEWGRTAAVHRDTPRFRNYISTGVSVVYLHADGISHKKTARPALPLPKTVLSATNATESPTAFLARREMRSWRLLHLETTALREPDDVTDTPRLGSDGSHLPATLYRLAREAARDPGAAGTVYERVAGRLHQLIQEVRQVDVDHDEKRGLLTLMATDARGTRFAARDLSDGTLRFLALAVLELDPGGHGLICFEEPENGIHPARIPAIMRLLKDIAVDAEWPVGPDNPLQQVIVNTHSPGVVGEIDPDDLLYAEGRERKGADGQWQTEVGFTFHAGTWRHESWLGTIGKATAPVTSPGNIKKYLSPVTLLPAGGATEDTGSHLGNGKARGTKAGRIADRPEYRNLLIDFGDGA